MADSEPYILSMEKFEAPSDMLQIEIAATSLDFRPARLNRPLISCVSASLAFSSAQFADAYELRNCSSKMQVFQPTFS